MLQPTLLNRRYRRRRRRSAPEGVLLRTPRSRRIAVWGVIGLLMLGAALGLASLLSPTPGAFIVFVSSDRAVGSDLAANAAVVRDRDSLLAHGYFRTIKTRQRSKSVVHRLEAQLADLAHLDAGDTVVIYVTGHSHVDSHGDVCLTDADTGGPAAVQVRLRDVLLQVQQCQSHSKLLVLDIVRPIHDPIIDLASVDVAGRIPAEIAAVPDPYRLTLTSCSPGQSALNSEAFLRTGFGYYFELGLRGAADGWNAQDEHNGRVSARELYCFVRDHVERWAATTQAASQTPLLFGAALDFDVIAISARQQREYRGALGPLPPRVYPSWLFDAWKRRDELRAGKFPGRQPRLYLQFEHAVHMAERQWRQGAVGGLVHRDLRTSLSLIEKHIEQARCSLALVPPQSLAMVRAQGHAADPQLAAQLAPLVKQIQSPPPGQTPDKAAAELAQLVDKFNQQTQKTPEVDVALAVVDALYRSAEPTPALIRTLDQLIAVRQPQPQYVETNFLRRLAQLADQVPTAAWPTDSVRQGARVTRLGERALSAARPFLWTETPLTAASQSRHNGEVLLLNPGYAPAGNADQTLTAAEYQLQGVLAYQTTLSEAYNTLDTARRRLPQYGCYLQFAPDKELAWRRSIQRVHQLDEALAVPLDQPSPGGEVLGARMEAVRQAAAPLSDALQTLARPWNSQQVEQLCRRGNEPGAGADVARQMRALLETLWLDADGRKQLWLVLRDLELRLHRQLVAEDIRSKDINDFDNCATVVTQRERSAALRRRVGWAINLLQLGGYPQSQIDSLHQRLTRLERAPARNPSSAQVGESLYQLTSEVSNVYATAIPQRLLSLKSPAEQVRLASIVPVAQRNAALDEPVSNPYTRYRAQLLSRRRNWLVDYYLYLSHDMDGAAFNSGVARQYIAAGGRAAPSYLLLEGPGMDKSLTWANPRQTLVVDWKAIGDETTGGGSKEPKQPSAAATSANGSPHNNTATSVRSALPDVAVFSPTSLLNASAKVVRQMGGGEVDIDLQLIPASDADSRSPARGVLLRLTRNGRAFHHKIQLPVLSAGPRLRVMLSTDAQQPSAPLERLRLRPAEQLQPYYLYIANPTDQDREVMVAVSGVDQPSPPVRVAAGKTAKVAFGAKPPKPGVPLPQLTGPLTIQLLDAKTNQQLSTWTFPLDVVSPRQYARVVGTRFVPHRPGVNELSVTLQAFEMPPGPPCMVELVLTPDEIPGLMGITSGVLRGTLPADGAPLTLSARNMLLADGYDDTGAFTLSVDGVERTFRYEATFARRGDPTSPWESMQPRLTITADPYARSAPGFKAAVHVENAPDGSHLELAIGRMRDGVFVPDLSQTSDRTRIPVTGFTPTGEDGALLFSVKLEDWTTQFDATGIVGRRIVQARLIDPLGATARTAECPVVFDDTPPRSLTFLKAPPQTAVGQPIDLVVQGIDDISGVAQVNFFLGKPEDGSPPQGAKPIPAQPVGRNLTQWQATLPGQKEAGPIFVSAQVTNHVGESSYVTTSINVTDKPAGAAGAMIQGSVTEGSRPQAGLQVVLTDDKKKVQGTAETDTQGRFEFKGVKPGKYSVSAVKASSQRKAEAEVEAKSGQIANVELSLVL